MYIDRLRHRRLEEKYAIGRIVHDGLAAGTRKRFTGDSHLAAKYAAEAVHVALDEFSEVDGFEKTYSMITWMMVHYFDVTQGDLQYRLVEVEAPFEVRIADSLTFQGVRDAVLYDPARNAIILQEHKTMASDPRGISKRALRDSQGMGYIYALSEQLRLGTLRFPDGTQVPQNAEVGAVHYNAFRKSHPRQPQIIANGLVSTAAIDTTPEIYEASLAEQVDRLGVAITDKQMDRLAALKSGGDRYFYRAEHHFSRDDLDRWKSELVVDAERIKSAKTSPCLRTRNPGNCSMPWSMSCAYEMVCDDPSPEMYAAYDVIDDPHPEVAEAKALMGVK